MHTILSIETSCDETSAAIIKDSKILSNIVSGQEIHAKYGGVIPEMASRCHIKNITNVVDLALKEADINKHDFDAIACTKGPGLLGALVVGLNFAKSLALALNIPFIGVNHILAHVIANFIDTPGVKINRKSIKTPLLCLLVSGGHTQIIALESSTYPFKSRIIGRTLDDSIGEAFDKIAKILGLPYPGGPIIDKLAQKGNPHKYPFPNTIVPDNNMSFSGIKTAFLYFAKDNNFYQKFCHIDTSNLGATEIYLELYDICASIQNKLINMVLSKFEKAIIEYKQDHDNSLRVLKTPTFINKNSSKIDKNLLHNKWCNFSIALAGGVAANSLLRKKTVELQKKMGLDLFIPKLEYCTDNAAMIAKTADIQFSAKNFSATDDLAQPRLKIDEYTKGI